MNIIVTSQGSYSLAYIELIPFIAEKLPIDRIGFYVTHRNLLQANRDKAKAVGRNIEFLGEWGFFGNSGETIDAEFIKKMEEEVGDPFLWNALIADRRIYNGVLTKYKQDYKPRFSHEEMLLILQKALAGIMRFIDKIRPDVIVAAYTPVSFGEYLFSLCARARGIRYLNLIPTKIQNYYIFSPEIYRMLPQIKEDYDLFCRNGIAPDWEDKVKGYLEQEDKRYDGVIIPHRRFPFGLWLKNVLGWPYVVAKYFFRKEYSDNQLRGFHWGYFYAKIFNPLKDVWLRKFFPYFSAEKLQEVDYAYYPLHVEPEINVSVCGREYLNQIELLRNVARSMPVTWKLVIKDHPAAVGRRNVRYYRKLLEIPNVLIVSHLSDHNYLIRHSKLVLTISGFSGFEAVLQKKPAVTFGRNFYNMLPRSMVRNVASLSEAGREIRDLLAGHEHREPELKALIAAVMKHSFPLNLYLDILGRKGRVRLNNSSPEEQKKEFSAYLVKCILDEKVHRNPDTAGAPPQRGPKPGEKPKK